ncbi:MAG TPA: dimethylsulfonioproprionate lyase family protein [Ktedonobacteraceae bacterium]|nr:dimethylsulfonioproprionate lyase family protein [Ktedonobacteraceae bacterium]
MAAHNASLHPHCLQANEGQAVWFLNSRLTLKATGESTGGTLSLIEALVAPETAVPWHVHHRDDEMFYILDGSFLFKCGDELFERGPGSFVFLPRGIPHSLKNVGQTVAKVLTLSAPAGLHQYFVDDGTPALEEGLPPQPVDPQQGDALAAKYGMEILGPPPF